MRNATAPVISHALVDATLVQWMQTVVPTTESSLPAILTMDYKGNTNNCVVL